MNDDTPSQHPPSQRRLLLLASAAVVLSALGILAVLYRASREPANSTALRPGPQPAAPQPSGKAAEASSPANVEPIAEPAATGPAPEPRPPDSAAATGVADPPADATDAPKGQAAAAAPELAPPWRLTLAEGERPPAFEDVCLARFDTRIAMPQVADLRAWFANAPYQPPVKLKLTTTRDGPCGAFTGVMRLRAPWPEKATLRLSLENFNGLKIHFFRGREGVTLAYYQNENFRWAAYSTLRLDQSPRPERLALTATDDDRGRRSELRTKGEFEIRHHAGELILSRGDIVLLRAPLSAPPSDVFLEGAAIFHGIAMTLSEPPPAEPEKSLAADIQACRELTWSRELTAAAELQTFPDGAVQLTAANADKPGWITTALPRQGLHEIILELEDATPGAGVFLARADGQPREAVLFVRNSRSGELCTALRSDRPLEFDLGAVQDRVVPQMAQRCWIKLVYGCGCLRWWISNDGRHWRNLPSPP